MMAQSCAKWKQTRGKMSRRRRQFVLWMALLVESVASSVFLPTRFVVVVVAYCRAPIWMKLTFFLTAFHMSPTTMQWVAWMGCLYRWSSGGDLEQHCWWLVECWIWAKVLMDDENGHDWGDVFRRKLSPPCEMSDEPYFVGQLCCGISQWTEQRLWMKAGLWDL